jgi:hypothetical protein
MEHSLTLSEQSIDGILDALAMAADFSATVEDKEEFNGYILEIEAQVAPEREID